MVDEKTGVFESPGTAIDDFRRHLKANGINCQVFDARGGSIWLADPNSGSEQRDKVHVQLAQPQNLDRVKHLDETWDGGSEAGRPLKS